MRNFLAVLGKESRAYFVSPIGYVLATVFLVVNGYFFRNLVMQFNLVCLQYSQQAQRFGSQLPNLNLNEFVVTQLFGVMSFISLFIIPMLTMRLYAEEKKTGTIELLMTSPISILETLLGKFVACLLFFSAIVGLTIAFWIILDVYGTPDWGPILTAYLGMFLLGAAFIAVGVFASSITENQIIAVAITFGALLLFWVIGWSASFAGPTAAEVLRYLSVIGHLQDFQRGVIDTKDVIFYISFITFFLFLAERVIESARWRG